MSLAAWDQLVAEVNGRTMLGMDGVRDPGSLCDAFTTGTPTGDCETDGHYLCDECERRATCDCGCGSRPVHCPEIIDDIDGDPARGVRALVVWCAPEVVS